MLSDRTKVVRGVMAFLAGCALLGLFMGLRGALPGNVDPEYESAPLSTPSGVVVEASPVADNLLTATNATNEVAANEVEEEEEAEETQAPPAPAPDTAPATPAPKEEAPPADPVGDLIAAPVPPPPGDLY